MANSNRIVLANGIVHPVGDASLSPEAERKLRRIIIQKALEALQTNLDMQRLFK
jgi:glycine reductase